VTKAEKINGTNSVSVDYLVSYLAPAYNICICGQHVYNFPLSFISPLSTQNNCHLRHVISPWSFSWRSQRLPVPLHITLRHAPRPLTYDTLDAQIFSFLTRNLVTAKQTIGNVLWRYKRL